MKRFCIAVLMAASAMALACVGAAAAAPLTVITEGLRNSQGRVAVAVFASEQGFPKEEGKAVRRMFVPIQDPHSEVSLVIPDLPAGTYAVAVFHDNDESGKLETSFFGVPRKGYGFSNNVVPSMRPASFNEAAFKLPQSGATVRVRLVYRGD